jgi:phenylalanyl-tRNA synthetase beta chain
LGTNFSGKDVLKLLEKARYSGKLVDVGGFDFLELKAPFYRTDLMHDVDLIEDVAIMHGYSNFDLQPVKVPTTGALSPLTTFSDKIRRLMIGFGAQEVQTFTLTDPAVFTKAKEDRKRVEIENPISQTYSVLRNKIWPTLIDLLSKNTNREYPQKIFEVGEIVAPNSKAETKSDTWRHLAFASAGDADFTYAKQVLCSLLASIGKECKVKESERKSFIPGRVGDIIVKGRKVGLVGELHPAVLSNFGIEMPVCVFELDLDYIL